MTLYIQVLISDNHLVSTSSLAKARLLDCFNRYNADDIITLHNLSIWSVENLDSYGLIINELLYVCKMYNYPIEIEFGENECYVLIRN